MFAFCYNRDMERVRLGLLQLPMTTVVEDPVVVVDDLVDRPEVLVPRRVYQEKTFGWNSRKKCSYNNSHGVRGRKPRKPWRDAN